VRSSRIQPSLCRCEVEATGGIFIGQLAAASVLELRDRSHISSSKPATDTVPLEWVDVTHRDGLETGNDGWCLTTVSTHHVAGLPIFTRQISDRSLKSDRLPIKQSVKHPYRCQRQIQKSKRIVSRQLMSLGAALQRRERTRRTRSPISRLPKHV
jgi:hypothetical protein